MHRIEDYERFIGAEAVDRILAKAEPLKGMHVVNVNSTYYGGGVAIKLTSLANLMNFMGIKAGWRVLQGTPDYFNITKRMHNGLQGGDFELTDRKKEIFEEVVASNAVRTHLENHDFVVIHDPQPLPMIEHYRHSAPWVWRCHIDLSNPHPGLWQYLRRFIDQYDAAIVSAKEYRQEMKPPIRIWPPAIDPFAANNADMSEEDINQRLAHYKIPTDLPLVVQVSRFDFWKDPQGVIEAYKIARKEVNCRLILLGNAATDDPEGMQVLESLLSQQEDRLMILCVEDSSLVNALQRKAAVVLQKSIREGFGLTVAEAMWKGKAVIGGNCGGIRYQIEDGVNGYLVDSPQHAGERIVDLLKDEKKRQEMGRRARETVRRKFLMSGALESYIDLIRSFEVSIKMKEAPELALAGV